MSSQRRCDGCSGEAPLQARRRRVAAEAAIRCLDLYRLWVSPWLPPACRFYPTCSEYSREAFLHHSVGRALWLTLHRLSRCHPFSAGGFDPLR